MADAVEVREHGMIFSAESVRAILSGAKTQTRRVVTDTNSQGNFKASRLILSKGWVDPGPSPAGNPGPYLKAHVDPTKDKLNDYRDVGIVDRLYPRTWCGDRIWVKESWAAQFSETRGNREIIYRAGGEPKQVEGLPGRWIADGKYVCDDAEMAVLVVKEGWRSPIHMHRWASRILLEVTELRVQRLQEVTEADCIAEGVTPSVPAADPHRFEYMKVWQSLNEGRGFGWAVNPFVWVYSFRRLT